MCNIYTILIYMSSSTNKFVRHNSTQSGSDKINHVANVEVQIIKRNEKDTQPF